MLPGRVCFQIVLELQMEIKRLKEENAVLRSRLGMTSDQEVKSTSPSGPAAAATKREKSPTKIEPHAQPAGSSKTGVASPLPDKQMKALEKLLCKDGNFQQVPSLAPLYYLERMNEYLLFLNVQQQSETFLSAYLVSKGRPCRKDTLI